MSGFGRFLELSVPTDDIQASLEFYRHLGFKELNVNDIRAYFYAVVTDGRIAIGLHGEGFDEPALSFVLPDIAQHIGILDNMGHEFTLTELGSERFHEIGLISPDGHRLRFMEARTFARQAPDQSGEPLIGRLTEFALRCADYPAAINFWATADFTTDDDPPTPTESKEVKTLRAPGIVLGLRPHQRGRDPVLRFAPNDIDAALDALTQRDIRWQRDDTAWVLTAPEGTRLELRQK